ncbi:MAG: hypothetical protein IKQ41_10890 [Clostridia bacterium]|nr:hypothetical protein [Clostridia bacterium]
MLCTHIAPDGDAIGSILAMGMGLKALGKQAVMACQDPVPTKYGFLPHANEVVRADALAGKTFDAAMNVDAAGLHLIGDCREAYLKAPVRLQIDHHPDNPRYADVNWVDGKTPAAGVLVRYALEGLGVPLNEEIAACLYCAISTDTGNFRFNSTNAETFEVMAELMDAGLDIGSAARQLHSLKEKPHLLLLSRALLSLRVFADGKCARMLLTGRDYLDAQADTEHREGIVNYALDIPGVEMAYLAEERTPGKVKVSLRGLMPHDTSSIARAFGGGGHKLASAFQCEGHIASVCEALDKAFEAAVEKNE